MKIGLVGWGIETKSAYRYFGAEHQYIIGNEEPCDDFPTSSNVRIYSLTEKRPAGLAGNATDLSYLEHYDGCDLIIYQGASRKNLEKKFPEGHPFWDRAKTTLHIFFEQSVSKNIIGVTGTKGKGTTSTLIARMLEASGKKVYLGGNIGVAVLDFMPEISYDDWVVLELSSFQLYKFPYSPHIAVHLMMMPEHIEEWHKTMEDYVLAKKNICSHQTRDDFVIYLPTNDYSSSNAQSSDGTQIPYMASPGARINQEGELVIGTTSICSSKDFKLLGVHNHQNICASATAVWQVTKNADAIRNVVTSFSGLEHRLELAGEVDGVKYYDDSFGTTPDTAIVAMDAFSENKVMIVGGHDKGSDMSGMCKRLAGGDIRHTIFIGSTGEVLRTLAVENGADPAKTSYHEDGNSWTMVEIIAEAQRQAKKGDIVLLSTGSASFGLFKDYKDRGNQFKAVVQASVLGGK